MRVKRILHTTIRNERGQAMAEFAFAIPIVILVLFGIYEFSRVYYVYAVLNAAVLEGASLATLPHNAQRSHPVTGVLVDVDRDFVFQTVADIADGGGLFETVTSPPCDISCQKMRARTPLITYTDASGRSCSRTLRFGDPGISTPDQIRQLEITVCGDDGRFDDTSSVHAMYNLGSRFTLINTIGRIVNPETLTPFIQVAGFSMENQYED